jgi:hypothetical protein
MNERESRRSTLTAKPYDRWRHNYYSEEWCL